MRKSVVSIFALVLSLGTGVAFAQNNQQGANPNVFTWDEAMPEIPQGDGKVSRGFIMPKVSPADGGAEVTVDAFHQAEGDELTFYLQGKVRDGNKEKIVNLKVLANQVKANPNGFRSQHKFSLSYDDINSWLAARTNSPGMRVGPGTPLYVFAVFGNAKQSHTHQWGGVYRGGKVTLPKPKNGNYRPIRTRKNDIAVDTGPIDLDVAATIDESLSNLYKGLKKGGQVRSRMEAEGKYEVPLNQIRDVKNKLFDLTANKAKLHKMLGADWDITVSERFSKRDQKGNILRDKDGHFVPDPMVDTYYDNRKYDAAKKEMAIRYRWTEGNRAGAWNLKPGKGVMTKQGISRRVEYGVDTVDKNPASIADFADSDHSMNPFRHIRKEVKGAKPSEFLKPSMKIVDTRYKFVLKHKNGMIVEMSLDDVVAQALRADSKGKMRTGRYAQLEMDLDHVGLQANTSAVEGRAGVFSNQAEEMQFFKNLSASANFDGTPRMHSPDDVNNTTLVDSADVKELERIAPKLRKFLLGDNWRPAAQKYAVATMVTGLRKMDPSEVKRYRTARKEFKKQRKLAGQERRKKLNAKPPKGYKKKPIVKSTAPRRAPQRVAGGSQ